MSEDNKSFEQIDWAIRKLGRKFGISEERPMKAMKIPDGMLEAARKAHMGSSESGVFLTAEILEAAIRWLGEQEASAEFVLEMSARWQMSVWNIDTFTRLIVREWIKHTFPVPPTVNPVVETVRRTIRGKTLTSGDAVEIISYVQQCVVPEAERVR